MSMVVWYGMSCFTWWFLNLMARYGMVWYSWWFKEITRCLLAPHHHCGALWFLFFGMYSCICISLHLSLCLYLFYGMSCCSRCFFSRISRCLLATTNAQCAFSPASGVGKNITERTKYFPHIAARFQHLLNITLALCICVM